MRTPRSLPLAIVALAAAIGPLSGRASAQAMADGGPPAPPPPQAMTGYATSKATAPYRAHAMAGYGAPGAGYSATAMSGYAGSGAAAPAAAHFSDAGGGADVDPLDNPNAVKAVGRPPRAVVIDGRGEVWVFDPMLQGWRNHATSALRFSDPAGQPNPRAAPQPAWVAAPDHPE